MEWDRYIDDFEWVWDVEGNPRSMRDVEYFVMTWRLEVLREFGIDIDSDTYDRSLDVYLKIRGSG